MSKCSPLITNIRLIIVTSNARTSSEPKINKGDSLMLAGGRVSWTQYKFRGDSYILSQDEYHALRQLNSPQLEKLLRDIRADRWAQFRDSHRGLLWIAVVAAVCVVLALAVPFFGIIAYFAWVCLLSLGLSALSRSFGLNRRRRFCQRSPKIATESQTYG